MRWWKHYSNCKSVYFRENFIFTNRVKKHTCHVKISRLGHDIPISVIGGVIRHFTRVLFSRKFAYANFRKSTTLSKISEFTVFNRRVDICVSKNLHGGHRREIKGKHSR